MPMTNTVTMTKADRLRPGTRAYGEHLLRLARIDAVAKARALGGPEDVARDQFENQEERQAGLRPFQESIDASQRAVADIGVQDRAAELAHRQTLAQRQGIAETGFADPNSPEARAAASAGADPAIAGTAARLRALSGPASMNPWKANDPYMEALDVPTHADFSPERMTEIAREADKTAAMSATGGGPMTVTDLQGDTSQRYIGPGAVRREVVPGTPGGLDLQGNRVAGLGPTVKRVPVGPDLAMQARLAEGPELRVTSAKARVLAGQAQGAQSQAQIEMAKYAGPAAAAGIALTQAQAGLIQNEVERGKVVVAVYQQAAKNPAQLAQLLGEKSPQEQAQAALAILQVWEDNDGDPAQIALGRSAALSQMLGQNVRVDPRQQGAIWSALQWLYGHALPFMPTWTPPPPFTMPAPVASPTPAPVAKR